MLSTRFRAVKPFDATEGMASSLGKRKTPTELRLEQAKRHQSSKVGEQQEHSDSQGFVVRQRDAVLPSRAPVDTDVNAAVDPEEKLRFRPLRSHKDASSVSQHGASLNEASLPGKGVSETIALFSRYKSSAPSSNGSTMAGTQRDSAKRDDLSFKGEDKMKGLCDSTFRDVRDISSSQSLLKAESSIDMVEALKKLAPRKALGPFDINASGFLPTDLREDLKDQSAADNGASIRFSSISRSGLPTTSGPAEDAQAWLPMKGSLAPLDLSLKLLARFTSPDSLHWCHRLSSNTQCHGVQEFTQGLKGVSRKADKVQPVASSGKSVGDEKLGATFWNSLHSWIHPQSSLPPAVLSVISSAAARGGEAVVGTVKSSSKSLDLIISTDFPHAFFHLVHDFRIWQKCNSFLNDTVLGRLHFDRYTTPFALKPALYSTQFVAMFVGGGVGGRSRDACTAYLTRSTRGVRQVLLEHDIKFSMPFSASGEPTTTVEDLQDLLEFEKSNPGQTRVVNERAASDNGPQSMLCFEGCSNVHRLYDFLLNHRSLISSTAAMDVPVLYAPTAFDNASLSVPEVTCKQLQRTDGLTKPHIYNGTKTVTLKCTETASNTTYTMEIKGTFLPPWVIVRLCTVLQESQPLGFSVRFATEPLTEGLNAVQEELTDNSKPANFTNFFSRLNGITNRDIISETKSESSSVSSSEFNHSSGIGTAVVKELKYEGGSYKAVLAPLQLANAY